MFEFVNYGGFNWLSYNGFGFGSGSVVGSISSTIGDFTGDINGASINVVVGVIDSSLENFRSTIKYFNPDATAKAMSILTKSGRIELLTSSGKITISLGA